MAYTLPDLGFAFDALEPHIDAQTMEIHHDKHHQAYVGKVNDALEGVDVGEKSIEAVLADLSIVPAEKKQAVINNGGGHANHTLFWRILAPGGASEPSGELAQAIEQAFGNVDTLKSKIENAGVTRFGSGWAWLTSDGDSLSVSSSANQDSPIMDGKCPILGIDVWEHAYYLKYQNRRPDYLKAIWNVINWDAVAENYAASNK
ncbi:MAG: superoxide dismutase [Candidatus Hydrogenedentes bacterium]|nr:superoxide dismutase [Candidatus Hydrogenedentota bacterium]